jgi:hemerythrin
MDLFQWNESFVMGIAEIDGQHRNLVEIVARLQKAVADGTGDESFLDILTELREYAVYHFETEERYMVAFEFEGYERHSEEHDAFVRELSKFGSGARKGGEALLTGDLLGYLVQWITEHVQGTDREYLPMFQAMFQERGSGE